MSEPKHFFIVGGMRCGSTYLTRLLAAQPGLAMASPISPEPKYFLRAGTEEKGIAAYHAEWFPGVTSAQAWGEKSVSYLETPAAADRIKALFPDAKILIILRDPAHRAVSHYWYTRNYGLEKRSLVEAFSTMSDREAGEEAKHISMPPYLYLTRGFYLPHIQRYQRMFGVENTRVVVLEDFLAEGEVHLERTLRFLEVDATPNTEGLRSRQNASDRGGEGTPPELLHKLAAFYAPSVRELSSELGLDLTHWSSSQPVDASVLNTR